MHLLPAVFQHLGPVIARAGGGGSGGFGGGGGGGGGFSGSGSGGSGETEALALIFMWKVLIYGYFSLPNRIGIWIVEALLLYLVWSRSQKFAATQAEKRRKKKAALAEKRRKKKAALATAAAGDPIWDEFRMGQFTTATAATIQKAWGEFDVDALRPLLTPHLFDKMRCQLRALKELGRVNSMKSFRVKKIDLTDFYDSSHDTLDRFTAQINATGEDMLTEQATGDKLIWEPNQFTEYWNFKRSGNSWRLDSIDQGTHSDTNDDIQIKQFATDHDLHYNADFGRLLLPTRGVLFKDGSFTNSDINNHVIGELRGQLIQLYSYQYAANKPIYTIVQATIPKRHSDILVRRKQAFQNTPEGLEELDLDNAFFTDRYRVYAAPGEDVTAFELLNPAFMEAMASLLHDYGFEAVDNSIYLFDEAGQASYGEMFDLLLKAFKELRL